MNARTARLCRRAAAAAGVSPRTVKRLWLLTPRPQRAGLRRRLTSKLREATA